MPTTYFNVAALDAYTVTVSAALHDALTASVSDGSHPVFVGAWHWHQPPFDVVARRSLPASVGDLLCVDSVVSLW